MTASARRRPSCSPSPTWGRSSDRGAPLILCPLAFERAILRRSGIASARLLPCCGPGARGVRSWVQCVGARLDSGTPIVLAGVAGGLDETRAAGTAWIVDAVVDPAGGAPVRPPWPTVMPRPGSTCAVVSRDEPVARPDAKRALGARYAAGLVDCESVAFAAAATARGWHWGIVRGVSDGASDTLPDVAGWIDARGRVRPLVAARALVRRPGTIGRLRRLRRASVIAMRAVAELLGTPPPAVAHRSVVAAEPPASASSQDEKRGQAPPP